MKKPARAAALLLLVACGEKEQPAQPPRGAPVAVVVADVAERTNLFNIAHGATVISRTAELTLDHSAIRAIDGDPESPWTSPSADPVQTLIFALPAPARIDRLGARIPPFGQMSTRQIKFETSTDGRSFTTVATHSFQRKLEEQFFSIPPTVAQYVRVTTLVGGTAHAAISSLHARGSFTSTPVLQPVTGCWSVNGFPAAFAEQNGRLSGSVGATNPIQLDGGREGLAYRFTWARGSEWGHALATVSPDGSKLTGIQWHEEGIAYNFGASWFGDRQLCLRPAGSPNSVVMKTWLRRAGRYPLYAFDDMNGAAGVEIIAEVLRGLRNQRMKIVAHEFREATPEQNRRRAAARLDVVRDTLVRGGLDVSRIDFEALGTDRPHADVITQSMRLLYSVLEIEIPQAARSNF